MRSDNPKIKFSIFDIFIITIFCFSLFGLAGISSAAITTIRFSDHAEVNDEVVRLGMISEIIGSDSSFNRKLDSITIGKSPLPGHSRIINQKYIQIRLKQNWIDLSRIFLQSSGQIKISRGVIEIPKSEIRQILLGYLYENLTWDKGHIHIKAPKIEQRILLPKGRISYKVIPHKSGNLVGSVPLSVHFFVDGQLRKKMTVTVRTEVLSEFVVTKKPLAKYQMITQDDIRLEKMNLAHAPSNAITNSTEILGKRTKKAINTKVILRTDLIELPPLVKRGDVVVIVAEKKGLKITALGEALKKGIRGERIKVYNLDSKKRVFARIVDSGTVKVEF